MASNSTQFHIFSLQIIIIHIQIITYMNKLIFSLCICLIAIGAQAQNKKKSKEEKALEKAQEVYKQQADSWAQMFELDEETTAKFTELYMEWQNNRGNVLNKDGYEQKPGADINFKKISVEEAERLIKEDFERQQKQAETDRDYYSKFQQYLSPGRAAQLIIQQRGGGGMGAQFRNMMRRGGGFGGGMMF